MVGGLLLAGCADSAARPQVERAPTISGTAQVGNRLTALPGRWRNASSARFRYTWQRCDARGRGCAAIAGATGRRYTVAAADLGARLRVQVRATTSGGSASARSAVGPPATLAAALGPSAGRSRYVSPGGSDAGPGTSARPWRTLGHALGELEPGDRLLLDGGTYGDAAVLETDGTPAAPITVTAAPGERPVLTARLKISADFVRVAGLLFDGPEASVYISQSQHVEFSGNEIRNVDVSGIYVGDDEGRGSDHVHILRNRIHDNGSHANLDHGIYFGNGRHAVIANNILERNLAYGIKLGPGALGALATHNTIVANGRSGIIVSGDDEDVSTGNRVTNNLLADDAEWAIRTYWESAGVGTDNVALGNLASGHPEGDYTDEFGGIRYEGNRSGPPGFAGDRALAPDSQAVDAALARWAVADDFFGRPRQGRPDVGAVERG